MTEAFDPDSGDLIQFDADATAVIITVCCACKRALGVKDGKGISGLSHTYCPNCYKDVLKQLGR